jgi:hypothetical protein
MVMGSLAFGGSAGDDVSENSRLLPQMHIEMMPLVFHLFAIELKSHSLLPPSFSFDTSASDRGVGGNGSADEGQDGASSHFRFPQLPLQSPVAAIRPTAAAEDKNPGSELQGAYRVAFGHWGAGEELQQEQEEGRDEDIPFEVIGGW